MEPPPPRHDLAGDSQGDTRHLFEITVDAQGFFHTDPPAAGGRFRSVGGPFRSVGEALHAAAESPLCRLLASETGDGPSPHARIYTRVVPLPLETFIRCPPWTEEYYFTLKDGLFHVNPDDVGGPFKQLADATDAVRRHRDWIKEREERARYTHEFFDNFDVDLYVTRAKELIELLKSDERKTEPPVERSWVDDILASLEPGRCDPAISEAVDRFERIDAEKQAIRNGMKWMQSEVLEAFEFYKASAGYHGPEYQFVKLDQQCLIYDDFSNSYHHYNFTMKKSSFYMRKKREKWSSSNRWTYQLFFAEVKSTEEGKKFFCCPLQPGEKGGCHGCKNAGIDLRHPENGEYEKGNEYSGFPFDSDSGCDD